MAHDVFISHSSKDKICADALCATLEKHNVRCWLAPRDILPGSDYGSAIVEGIKASKVMILIFSSNSNESAHVKREVERAVNHGIIIVPFKIEDVVLSSTMEYFVSGTHWLDAIDPPFENHLKSVAEYVCILLHKPTPIWETMSNRNIKIMQNSPDKNDRVDAENAIDLEGNARTIPNIVKSKYFAGALALFTLFLEGIINTLLFIFTIITFFWVLKTTISGVEENALQGILVSATLAYMFNILSTKKFKRRSWITRASFILTTISIIVLLIYLTIIVK